MMSRRVFLKNGAFALVSLGFAPSFLARTAYAQGRSGAREAAHRDLPARRRRRPQRRRPVRRRRVLPRAAEHRHRAAAIRGDDAAIDLDGFFGFNPRLQPLKPFWDERALAIVHACGSPDATRSHFDAQDYMETATPGVKSTSDGWLNRYLQARKDEAAAAVDAVPRRVADAAAAAHAAGPGAGAGDEPDRQFGIRGGQTDAGASFEAQYAAARRPRAERHGPRGIRRDQDAEGRRPGAAISRRTAPTTRAARSARRSSRSRSSTKADVGLEVAFADVGGWDTHVNQGSSQGQLATRLDDFARGIAALVDRPRRPHGRHRRPDDVGVRAGGERERQPRHRSRPRQRDDGHRRRRARRQGLRPVAGPRASSSATKAATSPSRPISATSSARSSSATSASRDPQPIFPGYAINPRSSRDSSRDAT